MSSRSLPSGARGALEGRRIALEGLHLAPQTGHPLRERLVLAGEPQPLRLVAERLAEPVGIEGGRREEGRDGDEVEEALARHGDGFVDAVGGP